jgi:hypothetical protein
MTTILTRTLLYVLACLPLSLVAGTPVGTWQTSFPDQNGNPVPMQVTMSDKGTYALDFGNDGVVETTGKYSVEGDRMMIQDGTGTDCTGLGVYTFKVEGETLTMTRVTDECTSRGGPEGMMTFTRVK